jgi:hypothetical protein
MRIKTPEGDQRAVITSWPCISPSGAEAVRLLLVTYDGSGNGGAWTPEQAKAQGLVIVAAEPWERRKLHRLGFRLSDTPKPRTRIFRR